MPERVTAARRVRPVRAGGGERRERAIAARNAQISDRDRFAALRADPAFWGQLIADISTVLGAEGLDEDTQLDLRFLAVGARGVLRAARQAEAERSRETA